MAEPSASDTEQQSVWTIAPIYDSLSPKSWGKRCSLCYSAASWKYVSTSESAFKKWSVVIKYFYLYLNVPAISFKSLQSDKLSNNVPHVSVAQPQYPTCCRRHASDLVAGWLFAQTHSLSVENLPKFTFAADFCWMEQTDVFNLVSWWW